MAETEWVVITTKYSTTCRRCYKKIKKGSKVRWSPEKRTVRHLKCKKKEAKFLISTRRPSKGGVRFVTGRG